MKVNINQVMHRTHNSDKKKKINVAFLAKTLVSLKMKKCSKLNYELVGSTGQPITQITFSLASVLSDDSESESLSMKNHKNLFNKGAKSQATVCKYNIIADEKSHSRLAVISKKYNCATCMLRKAKVIQFEV